MTVLTILAAGQGVEIGGLTASGLLLGLLLMAAVGGGYVSHLFRVPRVVGYLLAGALARVILSQCIPEGSPGDTTVSQAQALLAPVKELALGLILFSIGGIFDIRHVRSAGRGVVMAGAGNALVTGGLVFVGVAATGWWLSVTDSVPTLIAFSALLALAATSTAPAATLFTLREYEAKGPVTDTMLSVTGFNVALCLIGFHITFLLLAGLGALDEVDLTMSQAWGGMVLVVVGSIGLGGVLGFVLAVAHAKLRPIETVLILLAFLLMLASGQHWMLEHWGVSFSSLLAAMVLGTVFANTASDQDRLDSLMATIGPPLYVGFFGLAGFQLHFEDLWALGWIGVVYVLCRAVGKVLGTWLVIRATDGVGGPTGRWLGTGLLCQAAVVISLADFVQAHWQHEWAGPSFVTTILGSAVIFEILGPPLIKWLVVRCGEVKAVTLLRHGGATPSQNRSVIKLTGEALLRAFGLLKKPQTTDSQQQLQVRHLMRANVKCIPAAATFDEVLRLVEHSRYNHFPVTDDENRLVGVIHFKDLSDILYDPMLYQLVTAADLAITDPQAVVIDAPVQEAFAMFRDSDVASLPVVADEQSRTVVGIVEQRDLLRALGPGGDDEGGH